MTERATGVNPEARPRPSAALPAWVRERGVAAIGVLLAAGVVAAYAKLLGYDPESPQQTVGGAEGFLFEPTGGSPQLILAVSAWMLWNRRRQLAGALGQPAAPACWPLLGAGLAFAAWSQYTSAVDLLIPSLCLLLLGGAGLAAGRAGLRVTWLPALFLLFAVPLPPVLVNAIIFPLQMFTAKATMLVLSLMQIEALREGDMIHTPVKIFHVIETCSGMRVTVTLTFSAVIYAELFHRSRTQMLLLMALAPLIATIVNVARVLTIVLNPYSDLAPVHTAQGIAMVVLAVLVLAGVDRLLIGWLGARAHAPPRRRLRRPEDALARSLPRVGLLAAALFAVGISPALVPVWRPPVTVDPATIYRIPVKLGEWRANALPVDERFLGSVFFTERVGRVYSRGDEYVDLFIGLDRRLEREGSMVSEKTLLPSSGWELGERSSLRIGEDGLLVDFAVIESQKRQGLVMRWYSGTIPLWLDTVRSFLALENSRFRREGYGLVVRAATPLEPDLETATARLETFLEVLRPELERVDPAKR